MWPARGPLGCLEADESASKGAARVPRVAAIPAGGGRAIISSADASVSSEAISKSVGSVYGQGLENTREAQIAARSSTSTTKDQLVAGHSPSSSSQRHRASNMCDGQASANAQHQPTRAGAEATGSNKMGGSLATARSSRSKAWLPKGIPGWARTDSRTDPTHAYLPMDG